MYHHTEKSGFPREIEAPAEISILDTYREVCREVHPINSIAGRQKLSESIKNQLYEKIRAAFGIDMAAQSPVDIYPVFTPDPSEPWVNRVDFVVAPRRVEDIRLEVKAEADQGQGDEKEDQTMEWHCKECVHEKVCEEWREQEGMAACSYQNHFEPKQKNHVENLDGPLVGKCEGPLPTDLGKLSRQNCPNAGVLGTDDMLARYEGLASECEELSARCADVGANAWAAHMAECRDAIRVLLQGQKFGMWVEYRYMNETEIRELLESEKGNVRLLNQERIKAEEERDKYQARCEELQRRLGEAVRVFWKMDTGCDLCVQAYQAPADPDPCEEALGECSECRQDCRCKDCRKTPDGMSHWQFAGWDKLEEAFWERIENKED